LSLNSPHLSAQHLMPLEHLLFHVSSKATVTYSSWVDHHIT
jgi:hypothetical protein